MKLIRKIEVNIGLTVTFLLGSIIAAWAGNACSDPQSPGPVRAGGACVPTNANHSLPQWTCTTDQPPNDPEHGGCVGDGHGYGGHSAFKCEPGTINQVYHLYNYSSCPGTCSHNAADDTTVPNTKGTASDTPCDYGG